LNFSLVAIVKFETAVDPAIRLSGSPPSLPRRITLLTPFAIVSSVRLSKLLGLIPQPI